MYCFSLFNTESTIFSGLILATLFDVFDLKFMIFSAPSLTRSLKPKASSNIAGAKTDDLIALFHLTIKHSHSNRFELSVLVS